MKVQVQVKDFIDMSYGIYENLFLMCGLSPDMYIDVSIKVSHRDRQYDFFDIAGLNEMQIEYPVNENTRINVCMLDLAVLNTISTKKSVSNIYKRELNQAVNIDYIKELHKYLIMEELEDEDEVEQYDYVYAVTKITSDKFAIYYRFINKKVFNEVAFRRTMYEKYGNIVSYRFISTKEEGKRLKKLIPIRKKECLQSKDLYNIMHAFYDDEENIMRTGGRNYG